MIRGRSGEQLDGVLDQRVEHGEPVPHAAGTAGGIDDQRGTPRAGPPPRQGRARDGGAGGGDVLRFGRVEIDRGARVVRLDGAERPLTGYQFALLLALAENAGRAMSREALMDRLKGEPLEAFDIILRGGLGRDAAIGKDNPAMFTCRLCGRTSGGDEKRVHEPGCSHPFAR